MTVMTVNRRAGYKPIELHPWKIIKDACLKAGICPKCSACLGWGIRLGFSVTEKPCGRCMRKTLPSQLTEQYGDTGQQWLNGSH